VDKKEARNYFLMPTLYGYMFFICHLSAHGAESKLFSTLFPSCVQDIEKQTNTVISQAHCQLLKICAIKQEHRTFENTAQVVDRVYGSVQRLSACLDLISSIYPDEKLCKNACQSLCKLNHFIVDELDNNKELYQVLKEYVSHHVALSSPQSFFLSELMSDFKKHGLDLPDDTRAKIRQTKKEICDLELMFAQNIDMDTPLLAFTQKELTGLDDDYLNRFKTDEGVFRMRLDAPTSLSIMQNCSVASTRKKCARALQNKAYPINMPVLQELLAKRASLATMLGFSDYAHYTLSSQMAESLPIVQAFINHMIESSSAKYDQEAALFAKGLPAGVKLTKDKKIASWDFEYVKNQYLKKQYAIDQDTISEYFESESTIQAILKVYQKALGLRFKCIVRSGLWHKSVKVLQVYEHHRCIGYLLLDLYPRKNKYASICEITASPRTKDHPLGVSVVIANFPEPTADKPALLKLTDVEAFFHECGHAMHALLGCTEYVQFSGTNVSMDFVELPSQMFEQWAYDKDVLKKIGRHYKTGETLSDHMIECIQNIKNIDFAHTIRRQCYLSLFDLELAGSNPGQDVHQTAQTLYQKIMTHTHIDSDGHPEASFGHLTSYGSKYYGYLWSLVYALDIFQQIQKNGLLRHGSAQRFKTKILSKGGSADPRILLHDFFGRDANAEALNEKLKCGILNEKFFK